MYQKIKIELTVTNGNNAVNCKQPIKMRKKCCTSCNKVNAYVYANIFKECKGEF